MPTKVGLQDSEGDKLVNLRPTINIEQLSMGSINNTSFFGSTFKGNIAGDSSNDDVMIDSLLDHTVSADEVQNSVTIPPEEEEDDNDSIADDIKLEREAAVAKIRGDVWARDAQDIKELKKMYMANGYVSKTLVCKLVIPSWILSDVLNLIVQHINSSIIVDRRPTPYHKPEIV